MAFLDRIFGRNLTVQAPPAPTDDERVVERYEYLLRTAQPDTIEKAHLEAFEKLTPQQLDLLFERFTSEPPAGERPADSTPRSLAATASRAEARQPGVLTRTLQNDKTAERTGTDSDSPLSGSIFSTIAGYAIASSAIDAFFWAGLYGSSIANAAAPIETGDGGADTGFFGGFDF